jgi:hypothetical protein
MAIPPAIRACTMTNSTVAAECMLSNAPRIDMALKAMRATTRKRSISETFAWSATTEIKRTVAGRRNAYH